MTTNVNDVNTRWPPVSRGGNVGRVALLFGLGGRERLTGAQLRRMLTDLGLSADASRTLLARMVRAGHLTSHRVGRTTEYALAGSFAASFERVRQQAMTRPTPWPGHFHALLHAVPEEHRGYRDQLRRAALLTGYGMLQPGVLIALTDRSHTLATLLAAAPPTARIRTATLGLSEADAAEAAAQAWHLTGLAASYRAHIERLDRTRLGDAPTALRAFVDVLQPALTDTLYEPALDPALLPAHWPGPELRRAIESFEAAHDGLAAAYRDNLFT